MKLMKRPNVGSYRAHRSGEVRIRIIGREVVSKRMQLVRKVYSGCERPVMGIDMKGPYFCNASGTGQGIPIFFNGDDAWPDSELIMPDPSLTGVTFRYDSCLILRNAKLDVLSTKNFISCLYVI